jgi:ankyrin repeat protein
MFITSGCLKTVFLSFLVSVFVPVATGHASATEPDPLPSEIKLNADLMEAAKKGDVEQVRRLISEGANVNTVNHRTCSTPLQWASYNGNLEVVKLLLQNGARVLQSDGDFSCTRPVWQSFMENKGFHPIVLASRRGHFGVVQFLLAERVPLEKGTITKALHGALEGGYADIAELLSPITPTN